MSKIQSIRADSLSGFEVRWTGGGHLDELASGPLPSRESCSGC